MSLFKPVGLNIVVQQNHLQNERKTKTKLKYAGAPLPEF